MAQGRIRQLATRRQLKWALLVVTACLLALSFASLWHGLLVVKIGASSITCMRVGSGSFDITWVSSQGTNPHWAFAHEPILHDSLPLWFRSHSGTGPTSWWVLIPFWPIDIMLVVLTWWLWRTDRIPSGLCQKCRYDLAGLRNACCPECGRPTGDEA